jgi:hypothetical protein
MKLAKVERKVAKGKYIGGGKKEKKKKKKEKAWWETLLDYVGPAAQAAAKFIPYFLTPSSTSKNASFSLTRTSVAGRSTIHDNVPVGIATTMDEPARPEPVMIKTQNGWRYMRQEYLGLVETGVAPKLGDPIFTLDLDTHLAEWLARMANFEQYMFNNVIIKYVPGLPSTAVGSLVGTFEYDVDNLIPLGAGSATTKAMMAHETAKATDLWSEHFWVWKNENKTWLYVNRAGKEQRLAKAGRFSLVAGSDLAVTSFGYFEIVYDVEFRVCELQDAPGSYDSFEVWADTPSTEIPSPMDYQYWSTSGTCKTLTRSPYCRVLFTSNYSVGNTLKANSFSAALIQVPPGVWLMTIASATSTTSTAPTSLTSAAQGDYFMMNESGTYPSIASYSSGRDAFWQTGVADQYTYTKLYPLINSGIALHQVIFISTGKNAETDITTADGILCTWDRTGDASLEDPLFTVVPLSSIAPDVTSIETVVTAEIAKQLRPKQDKIEAQCVYNSSVNALVSPLCAYRGIARKGVKVVGTRPTVALKGKNDIVENTTSSSTGDVPPERRTRR